MDEEIRLVNRAIGLQPKLGPFAFYQVIIFFIFLGLSYSIRELFSLPWIFVALSTGALTGALLALLGNKPWLFWSRHVAVPNLVRGGAPYLSLLSKSESDFRRRRRS